MINWYVHFRHWYLLQVPYYQLESLHWGIITWSKNLNQSNHFFPVFEFSKKGWIATEDLQSEQGGVHNQQGCKVLPRYKKFKPGIRSSYQMQNSPEVPQNMKYEMIFFSPCPILSPTEEKYRIFLSIFTITFCINM